MHLISTKTLHLKEFVSEEEVKYAILSHRWGGDEVLFEDMNDVFTCTKTGVSKVRSFCHLAQQMGYDWAWIDTCCIDKKSSAELSEAINSMYRWYQAAAVCVAYLSDVDVDADAIDFGSMFKSSVWFTRCWTLQELLAPRNVVFYNESWAYIGAKSEKKFVKLIARAARIPAEALNSLSDVSSYSVGERMAWASQRQATRAEDEAYSLLGLFGVNMPMLYGEGRRAFERLQLEILRANDDETIFAWEPEDDEDLHGGLLAPSPRNFRLSAAQKCVNHEQRSEPFTFTSRGITASLTLSPTGREDTYLAILNVARTTKDRPLYFGIYLQPIGLSDMDYMRVRRPTAKLASSWKGSYSKVCLQQAGRSSTRIYVKQRTSAKVGLPQAEFALVLSSALTEPKRQRRMPKFPSFGPRSPLMRIDGPSIQISPNTRCFTGGFAADREMIAFRSRLNPGPICNLYLDELWHDLGVIHFGVSDTLQPVLVVSISPNKIRQRKVRGSDIENMTLDYSKLPRTSFLRDVGQKSEGVEYTLHREQPFTGIWVMIGERREGVTWKILKVRNARKGFAHPKIWTYEDSIAWVATISPVQSAQTPFEKDLEADIVWRLDIREP